MLTRRMESEHCRVIDRSGLNQFSNLFLLMEPDAWEYENPHGPTVYFILHIKVDYADQEIHYRETDESSGIDRLDCPTRLIKMADLSPPINEISAQWRKDVRSHNAERRSIEKIFRQMDQLDNSDHKGRSIVLKNGNVVIYSKGHGTRGRTVRACYENHRIRQLRGHEVDVAATQQLHTSQ